jgi:hypothetical protein
MHWQPRITFRLALHSSTFPFVAFLAIAIAIME